MSTSIRASATPPAVPPAIAAMGTDEELLPEETCAPDVAELALETTVTVTTCTGEVGGGGAMSCVRPSEVINEGEGDE